VCDNQRVLSWLARAACGWDDLRAQLASLAGVPASRRLPLDRLTRNLEAAEVTADALIPGPESIRGLLLADADAVRGR
jgi:hypothetical protein